jgi:hypothetical protein
MAAMIMVLSRKTRTKCELPPTIFSEYQKNYGPDGTGGPQAAVLQKRLAVLPEQNLSDGTVADFACAA